MAADWGFLLEIKRKKLKKGNDLKFLMPWPYTAKMIISQTTTHYFGDGRESAFKGKQSSSL